MEQILQSIVTVAHVILAGLFALMPGTLVWLVVLGAFLAFRHLGRSFSGGRDVYRRLRSGGKSA